MERSQPHTVQGDVTPQTPRSAAAMLESDEAYIRWELARVRARVEAYQASRSSGDVEALAAVVARQNADRVAVRAARAHRLAKGARLHFEFLVRRLELAPLDEDVLALAMTPHLSTQLRWQMLKVQGTGRDCLEVGFLGELLYPSGDGLSFRGWADANSRLIQRGVLEVAPPVGGGPVSRLGYSVRTPQFIAAAARGEVCVDERLSASASIRAPRRTLSEVVFDEGAQDQVECCLQVLRQSAWGQGRSLLITGDAQSGKSLLAEALATQRDELLFTLDAAQLNGADAESLLALAGLNASFYRAALHIVRPETLLSTRPAVMEAFSRLVGGYGGLVILEVSNIEQLRVASGQSLTWHASVFMSHPDAQRRELIWRSMLPRKVAADATARLGELATRYDLSGGQLSRAVDWATQRAAGEGRDGLPSFEDFEVGAKNQLASGLQGLTRASQVGLGMEHLVLPDDVMAQVLRVRSACRNRQRVLSQWGFGRRLVTGKGLVTLFSGEAGTGKTLTAEILAREVGLTLRIVSLPDIVSKWVGETEKNVRDIFRQARADGAMLLFDEADALFGRRVKVESSQDKYQNMEVNNLLQEIERFEGVVILTTNLEANMDAAFARRILYKIHFPMPELEQRQRIWQSLIPAEAPLAEDVDFELLAEDFELSGGQIKNAIMRAAYDAMDRGASLDLDALLDAAHTEATAAGKLSRQW